LQTRFQILFAIFAALPIVAWLAFEYVHRPAPKNQIETARSDRSIPEAKFTDITKAAGINFVHRNGASAEKLLPETMGGGCAFFDFDNDGDPDLLLVNSKPDPESGTILALYQNDGRGNFADVTANSGLRAEFFGMGVAAGDFDNDGFVDLFITGVGENKLFRNLGAGKFQDVTARAGFTNQLGQWSTSAAWIDFDNDGDLDLFVCNYVKWTREIDLEVNSQLPGIGRAYARPMNFPGSFSALFRNDGKGQFTDISAASGIQVKNKATGMPLGKSLGIAPVDLDGDGWIDLIVANDTAQNFVFHNEHNGTFKEIGAASGLAFDAFGAARGAMGIDTGRFQDENSLGVSIGNFANEMTALYVTQRDPLVFSDEAIRQGIGSASRQFLTFGVFFFDYDLDGWLDLLTVNGHIEPNISKVLAGQTYQQPAQLYWNARGAGKSDGFLQAPASKCGADILKPLAGRGSAYADIDGDGDLDVIITQVGGPPMLLRNDQQLHHHWIKLKLSGTRDNRDAIGAWVRIRIGNRMLSQQVMAARGYMSQSELPLTEGLGLNDRVDELEILWPSGMVQKQTNPAIDRLTVIQQLK
jgi:hypothetical protein